MPNAVGWELNNRGRKASRCISLAKTMDPNRYSAQSTTRQFRTSSQCPIVSFYMNFDRLAVEAADLNLKLMRWRQLPSLNLSVLSSTRCLLLGAGTLGCQVARMLMVWILEIYISHNICVELNCLLYFY